MLRWVSGRSDSPGVETWKEFSARVSGSSIGSWRSREGADRFAFTSGGPIAAAVQYALSLTPDAAIRLNGR
jgi:broad specificity phosphatase PhoE